MRTDSNTSYAAPLAVSATTIVLGLVLMTVGALPAITAPAVERVRAEAVAPKVKPKTVVKPIAVAARGPSAECPQMDNPGGRLRWAPTKHRGPSPTGGRVVLPTLGVDAPVVRVGIDARRHMVVPRNARDVAWLDRGGIPGYTNNVVLAGHIAYSRVRGSFGRIGDLKKRDVVELRMNGKTYKYRVVWNCLFGRKTDRAGQIMGYTHVPSVTLISCGGGWDAAAGTHSGRIAVRAEQITKPPALKLKRTTTDDIRS